MPMRSPCMNPKNVSTRAGGGKAAAFAKLRSMMKTAIGAEDEAAEDGAAAEHFEAVVQDALVAHRLEEFRLFLRA